MRSNTAMKDRALSDTAVINALAVLRNAGFFSIVPPAAEPVTVHPLQQPAPPTPGNLRGTLSDGTNRCKIWDLRNNYRAGLTARDIAFLDKCEQAGASLSIKDRCRLDALWRGLKFADVEECA